jgi:hypothetical protein
MKISVSGFVCVVLLLATAWAGAGTTAVPPGAVLLESASASDTRSAKALAAAALEALDNDDEHQAQARLAAAPDHVSFELAAASVIDALRGGAPSSAGTAVLQWLASQPVRVYVRHEETGADWFVPWQSIAARAAGTLDVWRAWQERQHWSERIATQPEAAFEALLVAPAAQHERAAEALAVMPGAMFDRFAALASARPDQRLPAIRLAIAQREPTFAAFERALRDGDQIQQLALIARANELLPPADAVRFLERGALQPPLASAAVLAMAELAATHPPALDALKARLDDPDLGPSIAAGLARLPVAGRVAKIESMLGDQPVPTRAFNLALALRLEGSSAARDVLRRWSEDPRLPDALRGELQR